MKIVLLITLLEGFVLTLLLMTQRYYKNRPSGASSAVPQRSSGSANDYMPQPRDTARWAFINEAQSEGQADDRNPMLNTVAGGAGSSAARRSSARRSHQLHFKKWSTDRHD